MNNQQQLEERIAYCEEFVDSLNEVVVDLQRRLQSLELQNLRLIEQVKGLQNLSGEPFNPRDEKPPHY